MKSLKTQFRKIWRRCNFSSIFGTMLSLSLAFQVMNAGTKRSESILLAKLSTTFLNSQITFYKQDRGIFPDLVEASAGQYATAKVRWPFTFVDYFPSECIAEQQAEMTCCIQREHYRGENEI